MRNSTRNILFGGLLGALSSWGGLVTSVTAEAYALGGVQHVCNSGIMPPTRAVCSATSGNDAAAFSEGTAGYGTVAAYVSGGAFGRRYGSSAMAMASSTDLVTFFGATGTGVVTIWESILRSGTGSLDFGALGGSPQYTKTDQTFTFGTPFALTLSAFASGNFLGGECDGGSLLVQQSIASLRVQGKGISYTDASGHSYNTEGTAAFTATPEPAGWMLGVIGLGLVGLAKRQFVSAKTKAL